MVRGFIPVGMQLVVNYDSKPIAPAGLDGAEYPRTGRLVTPVLRETFSIKIFRRRENRRHGGGT
jgi:hypothetical protein